MLGTTAWQIKTFLHSKSIVKSIAKPKLYTIVTEACCKCLGAWQCQGVKPCQFVQAPYRADITYVPNTTKQHAAAQREMALLQFCTVWCSRCIARYRTTLRSTISYKRYSARTHTTVFEHNIVQLEIDCGVAQRRLLMVLYTLNCRDSVTNFRVPSCTCSQTVRTESCAAKPFDSFVCSQASCY